MPSLRTHSSSTRRLANHCAAISGARPTRAATAASCASDGAGHSLYAAARRLSWPVGAPLRRVGGSSASDHNVSKVYLKSPLAIITLLIHSLAKGSELSGSMTSGSSGDPAPPAAAALEIMSYTRVA